MIFSRNHWLSLVLGAVCIALVPGLVFAQQSFSGISKRLQGMEARILAELNVVRRVIDDGDKSTTPATPATTQSLQGYRDTIHPHSLKTVPTCNTNDVLNWNGSAWVCSSETDPSVLGFARTNLPVCASTHALIAIPGKGGITGFSCTALPTPTQGDKPDHQWSGTQVRFESNYGTWGTYTNLRGPKGATGICP